MKLVLHRRHRASELVRRLVGQRTSNRGGRCVYRRKGLLDEIPYVRLIPGGIIARTEDEDRVCALLRDWVWKSTRDISSRQRKI